MSELHAPARTRFAPSPTGYLHLGGLRTALFAWLWARHTNGQFILRIEDTDQNRYQEDSLDDLMRGLRWLGLEWDEGPEAGGPVGPYIQSRRREIYQRYVQQLIDDGYAYRSYMSAEELDALREEQRARGDAPGYDRRDRYLTPEQIAAYEAEGRPSVVRFSAPLEGKTTVHDLIRGDITVENESVRDPVILKSDGLPTYHLAVVVDDHLMGVTDVLRGEEWISSTPLHQMLYAAFDWDAPRFIHLPVILDPSGQGKMSKRKKVVDGHEYLAQVHEFIDAGYLPEAVFNLLTNVGWNFDAEREIFTREEAIERFDVADINPSPGALPYAKLEWLNGVYIRDMAPAELQARLIPYLSRGLDIAESDLAQDPRLPLLVPLIQERLKTLAEAAEKVEWAFQSADEIDYSNTKALLGKKLDAAQSADVLATGYDLIENAEPFTADVLEQAFRAKTDELGLKAGSFFSPFRGALTGKMVAPPLFDSMVVLGRDETLIRVRNGEAALRKAALETT
ncbi:MAG: glutamate--tRNA ligase [Caldilineaceae bacterium]|nr:glutamate--tRNA ligase [Caldilineaceae bacterium]